MTPTRPALAAALLGLSACGPLVQIGGNDKAPVSLLTINATAQPVAQSQEPVKRTETIGVELPGVPTTLQTLRLPVVTSPTEVSYLVGATWAEQPNRQFQRLLADTLAASGQSVIDMRQSPVSPAHSLSGTLRSFGLDVQDPANPVVRVRFDAQIASPGAPQTVRLRRFETTEPSFDQRPAAVAAALNRAANRIAGEVAVWAR
jgi:cholesterol transport system auxiliary component